MLKNPDPAALQLKQIGDAYHLLDDGDVIGSYPLRQDAECALALLRVERESWQLVQDHLRPLIAELQARGFSEERARELIGEVVC
jgi:hypothetical protein